MMKRDIKDALRFKAAEVDSGSAMNHCPPRGSQCLKHGIADLIMHERTNASGCSLPDQTVPAWLDQQFQHTGQRNSGQIRCHLDGEILAQDCTNTQQIP